MKGRKPPAGPIILPPTRVIARQSSDLSTVPSRDVSLALQFIRENFIRSIRSADVLARVPVSRRTLERNFRFFVGRSIGDEINRSRINLAEQLLIETDLSIGQIAQRAGFTEAKYLSTEFHRAKGLTPTAFRKQHRIYLRPS
jgi:LacI family transcriptional regulator